MPTTTSAFDLEIPALDVWGLDRRAALAQVTELARESWLARTDIGFAAIHYEDAIAILRDRRFFNALSEIRNDVPEAQRGYFENRRPSILAMEGEDHLRLRRLVSPAFTPASANRHRASMREVFTSLLEPALAAGGCEFVAEVADPYPIPIICEVLGAPKEDWRKFSAWATDIFRIFNGNLADDLPLISAASEALSNYVTAMIEDRRVNPGADLLSDLIAAEEEGDRLDNDELVMLTEAVLMAGTDTTRNQLGCAMAIFAEHPDQWALLVDNPALAPQAVEESMRYLGAVRATVRIASEDIVYKDVLFPKGTVVTTHLAAGNRDPEVFDSPDAFDITKSRATEQMTFGSGIHRCLGAALARAELQEALTVLAERVVRVESAGPVTWKPSTFGIWGPATLPLTFTTR
jgi:cytochrome P450